jgi:hypothetical protein
MDKFRWPFNARIEKWTERIARSDVPLHAKMSSLRQLYIAQERFAALPAHADCALMALAARTMREAWIRLSFMS